MIRRILCFLGFKHDWHYKFGNVRVCWYCGKKQGVYDE